MHLLTINGGSSSIKFAVFETVPRLRRQLSGVVERIGIPGTRLRIHDALAESAMEQPFAATDAATAADRLLDWLDERLGLGRMAAVGHRVVHGGERYRATAPIDRELLAELERLRPLDPAHLPSEIGLIEALRRRCPTMPAFACFDTAFHHTLPRKAALFPIPRRYAAQGVRRYGFHGLSFAYLLEELGHIDPVAAKSRLILAHLGAGCSLAAVRAGVCVETTMGLTPTAGLVMGTRSGDLDPGLILHLLREERLTLDELDDLINKQSGLLGISEISADLRDVLQREKEDPRAAEAAEVFCYHTRKWIGALAAALGGLDGLVFSAGIGAHSAVVRARICAGLEFLGLALDPDRNRAHEPVISATNSAVTVRVMPTDEEIMIAREVLRSLNERTPVP